MEVTQKYIHEDEVPYGDYSGIYPEEMMRTMRAKRIIHPNGAIKHDELISDFVNFEKARMQKASRWESDFYKKNQGDFLDDVELYYIPCKINKFFEYKSALADDFEGRKYQSDIDKKRISDAENSKGSAKKEA